VPVSKEKFATFLTKEQVQEQKDIRRAKKGVDDQVKLLKLIKNEALTSREVAEKLHCSRTTAYQKLLALRKKGLAITRYEPDSFLSYWMAL